MSPQESCQQAEAGLQTAGQLLLSPSPDALESCLPVLRQVIEILETLAARPARDWEPALRVDFHRIQANARHLQLQIQHGANLVHGWMQRRLSAGYTRAGLPEFDGPAAERLFEA